MHPRWYLLVQTLMSGGKLQLILWEAVVTFRWEVGFALSFVGPVYHQVPIATETVGNFICKNKENRRKTDLNVVFMTWSNIIHGCSCNMHMKDSTQSNTQCWDRHSFYFLLCSCCSRSHCIKQEHRPGTSRLHWAVETHEFFNQLSIVHHVLVQQCRYISE